ncbi:Uncharacterised protein [Pseudomonas taetrolens]|nr:Uncharacterised protein [Pseudomonas taetrolens]
MDTPNSQQKAAHLLNDLESIRKLLGDDGLQPPLLTDMVSHESTQIPLLSEMIGEEPTPRPPPHRFPRPKKLRTPCWCTWIKNCAQRHKPSCKT